MERNVKFEVSLAEVRKDLTHIKGAVDDLKDKLEESCFVKEKDLPMRFDENMKRWRKENIEFTKKHLEVLQVAWQIAVALAGISVALVNVFGN